uniref:Mucin 13b, cell surface associated n=1 Tax=Gasterosteus aculeatus aculeatus TaxID=481459 RepID=A0AAQ4P3N8_GASAC
MAQEMKPFFVLWVVVAFFATQSGTTDATSSTGEQTASADLTPVKATKTGAAFTTIEPKTAGAETTTVESVTTGAATATVEPGTTSAATTTVESVTTGAAITTVEPGTTGAVITTLEPGTTSAATATVESVTTGAAITTVEPGITSAATTTVEPVTTGAAITTVEPVTTGVATTAVQPVTTDVATTTLEPVPTGAATTILATLTTANPDGSSTTPKPPTDTPTTKPSDSTTTANPDGSPTTPKPPTDPPTTKPLEPCDGNPCSDGSTCEPRHNQTFECLCLAGDSYDTESKSCQSAKVFPGQLTLPGLEYNIKMADKTSQEFKKASLDINKEITMVFKDDTSFSGSTVVEISKASPVQSKVWSMSARASGTVNATVEIIFKKGAEIKETDVLKQMKAAVDCADCLLKGAQFKNEPLCALNPCDNTTKCEPQDGDFTCTCLEQFIKTDFGKRLCIACPSGKKAKDSKECVDCPFGYSGFNCGETWKLSLVIAGTVLGGLLLIALILLPVLVHKYSKKVSKNEKSGDMEPYARLPPTKQSMANGGSAQSQHAPYSGPANRMSGFPSAGAPRIPRATATNSWEKRANMEMTPSSRGQNLFPAGGNSRLYDDHGDMNPVAQSRPQSNPYTQNQPRANLYGQSQGHSNPYYMHDNGKRF